MPEASTRDVRLYELAAQLIWWKGLDEALADERRFLALAMTLRAGDRIPKATVPEFERKVNELMLVSLSLTSRPKRRKVAATARRSKCT
jgi:hypothetical protein